MPEQQTTETPGEKTMRRFYETELASRAILVARMGQNRRILDRLALKQQNGTLGKPDPDVDKLLEDQDVQVRIGDEVHYHSAEPTPTAPSASDSSGAGTEAGPAAVESPKSGPSLLKQAATLAAIMAGMGGSAGLASWLTSALSKPAETQQPSVSVPAAPGYGVEVEKAK